jgi:uncharacterized damage-inducible protein DinB
MATKRTEPGLHAGEREMLTGWLDYHRATLALKCEGLSDEQLRERSVQPSGLSLIGLVRHLSECERGWFRRCLAGEDLPPLYYSDEDPDGDFDNVGSADPATVLRTWEQECDLARQAVAAAPDLDTMSKKLSHSTSEPFSLRWIITHMIEEYARHNGHADLLRERIDGVTGD